jgi:hypothetical protein
MLFYVTDAVSKQRIALNASYIQVVFVAQEGDMKDKTIISMSNGGTIVCEESQIEVVGIIEGQLAQK